ncbi:hypothetical protein [Streptomyces omiyaensis]|uniref:GerMN domain-containing protein n=1 Tax=Streptomyces omiyaensis TaxID=68247 RepID=A0ABW7BXF7_9ACTN
MRRRAAGAALLAALVLTGCGIQGSEVVEAGIAPTVAVRPAPDNRMLLYFLGPDGELMPVSRDVGFPFVPVPEQTLPGDGGEVRQDRWQPGGSGTGPDTDPRVSHLAATKVLAALLAGPGAADRQAGLTTDLPASGEPIRVESEAADGLRLLTPFLTHELSERAVTQLVCTAAYAVDPAGAPAVTVQGPDGALPPATCGPGES